MRRLLAVLLASCASPDVSVFDDDPVPVTSTRGPAWLQPDPWRVPDGPRFGSYGGVSPAPVKPPPELPALLALAPASEPVSAAPPRSLVTAMHSQPISVLAATEDGRAVVTADAAGSVRLWPSTTGTSEPVVVAMQPPKLLSVVHLGSELVVAGVDEIGQLELVWLRASGEVMRRAAVESSHPVVAVRATSQAFVALRADRAIVVIGVDGKVRGELVAEPGQHVTWLAARRDRVLAIVDEDGTIRGRWIDPRSATWGALTKPLPIDGTHVELAPDHERIAAIQKQGKAIAIVKLATGGVVSRPAKERFVDPTLRPIGFSDRGALVFAANQDSFYWYDGAHEEIDVFGTAAVVGGRDFIAASGSSLAIGSPGRHEYLGYRMGGPQDVLATGNGFVVTDGNAVVRLDAQLATREVHEMPAIEEGRYRMYPSYILGRHHVLAAGYNGRKHGIYVVDLERGEARLVADQATVLDHERATGLVAFEGAGAIELLHWNAKTSNVGERFALPDSARSKDRIDVQVMLLDPAVARGNAVALVTVDREHRATVTLFRVRGGDRPVLEQTYQRTRQLADDWFERHGVAELVPVSLLRHRERSPDRALVAELHDLRITLRDAGGTERWSIPNAGVHALVWTPKGELFAAGSGIARVDLESGALAGRRCGWRFGRWPEQPGGAAAAALCEAR